jgi:uncharacterized protein DUF5681
MSEEYEIGYKRPPRATRWQKGQSGNPKGRLKGTRNLKTELGEELAELIPIREQGRSRKVSKQRALIKAHTAKAIQGDVRAANLIVSLIIRLLQAELSDDAASVVSEDDADIIEAFLKRREAQHSSEDQT